MLHRRSNLSLGLSKVCAPQCILGRSECLSLPGKLVIDTVQLGNLTIAGQTIGICSSSEGFDEFDGVLG